MATRVVILAGLIAGLMFAGLLSDGTATRAAGPSRPHRLVLVHLASDSSSVAAAPADISPVDLVQRLVQAPDLVSAVAATQEALARAGVTTIADGAPYMRAIDPVGSMTVMIPETARLAIEARNRDREGMLTAAELGQMLKDFGWGFPAGSDPGKVVVALLQGWVSEARKAPSEPLNFTPLFLQAMAAHQLPPVDLAAGTTSPDVLRITGLELEIFAAAFDRGLTSLEAEHQQGRQIATDSKGPCSFIKESTGKIGAVPLPGQVTDVLAGEVFGDALKAGLQRAGMSEGSASELGDALTAVGTVMRVWKLVEIYRSGNVQVVAIDRKLHKPVDEDDIDVAFQATAGVSDTDWDAYQQQMGKYGLAFNTLARDCLDSLGLPAVPDLSVVAADVENWRVEWQIVEGSPELALVSPRNTWTDAGGRPLPGAGRLEKPLTRKGDYSATTDFLVNILPETRANHESGGPLVTAPVTVKASLKTNAAPSLSTFINGAKGGLGLVDAVVELAAGWFQVMVTPKSYATVDVEYEAPSAYLLDFETTLGANIGTELMKIHVLATNVPISFGAAAAFPVSQPLEIVSFTGDPPGPNCTYSNDIRLTRPFVVRAGRLMTSEQDGVSRIDDVELDISIGDLAGSFTWTCTAPGGGTQVFTIPVPDGELSGRFTFGHVPEAIATDPANRSVIRFRNWQMGGTGWVARKTYSVGPPLSESTILTLRRAGQ